MKDIRWENNLVAQRLAKRGAIRSEDIIPKCATSDFEHGATTIRVQRITSKHPSLDIHVRGAMKSHTYGKNHYYAGQTVNYSSKLIVHLDTETGDMEFNGYLSGGNENDLAHIISNVKRIFAASQTAI